MAITDISPRKRPLMYGWTLTITHIFFRANAMNIYENVIGLTQKEVMPFVALSKIILHNHFSIDD